MTTWKSLLAIFATSLLASISAAQQPLPNAHSSPVQSRRQASTDAGRAAASISGKLLVDGQPLAGVRIVISAVGSSASLMETMMGKLTIEETEDDGRFKFEGLGSTAFMLRPMLTGYVVESGVVDPDGQQIYYRPGDFAAIRMVKGGVITGQVFAENGMPMVGVPVRAVRLKDLQGRHVREVTPLSLDAFEPITTDDRGVYRIYGLEPGIYAVCAGGTVNPDSMGPFDNDSPVYHPGGPLSDALEVAVRPGRESAGIDISYHELSGSSISGTLGGRIPGGTLFSGAAIMLSDATTGALQAFRVGLGPNDAAYRNRGFLFGGVPDEKYKLTAIGGLMGDEMTAAAPRSIVVQGSDVTGVDLILGPLAEVSGRVVLDAPAEAQPRPECNSKPAPVAGQSVIAIRSGDPHAQHETLGPLFSRTDEAVPNDKGEFKIRLISSGLYYIQTKLPGDDLYVRSMTLPPLADGPPARNPADGLDISIGEKVTGVTITLARGAASLAGRVIPDTPDSKPAEAADGLAATHDKARDKSAVVQDSNSQAAEKPRLSGTAATRLPDRLQVIIVPAEPEAATDVLRYAESMVRSDGSFVFSNLSPGRYYLLTRSIPDEQWNNPGSPPGWYKIEQRKQLHPDAKKAAVTIELNRCSSIKDYLLRYSAAPPSATQAATRP